MDNKALTPIQLWQDFNPVKEDLSLNVIAISHSEEGYSLTECYFTALRAQDGAVRVYVRIYRPDSTAPLPVIVYINDYTNNDADIPERFLAKGYAVVTFDYTGISKDKERYTLYPDSLKYGNLAFAGDALNSAKQGAENTCVFLWTRIARRVLSLITDFPGLDKDRIAGVSWGEGANILWQLAGIDGRLNAIVPILNCGWQEYSAYPKYLGEPPFSEERLTYEITCSVQSYVKFVMAKTLVVCPTNSSVYSFDRVEDTLNRLPKDTQRYRIFSQGMRDSITLKALDAIFAWLNDIFNNKRLPVSPEISYALNEGKLDISIESDATYSDVVSAELHTAYGELNPALRSWHKISLGLGMDGKAHTPVKVYDTTERIFLFAKIRYKNGSIVCSPQISLIPAELGEIVTSPHPTRIIFERKMGASAFFLKTDENVVSDSIISLATGPLDIPGVSTSKGCLVLYNIGDLHNNDDELVLQFDVYAPQPKTIKVVITDSSFNEYSATINIDNVEEWTKVRLGLIDFKDKELIPLKLWQNVKILTFCDAEGALFNNILWV